MKIYFPRLISLLAIATTLALTSCGGDDPTPTPITDTENPEIETPTIPLSSGFPLGVKFIYSGAFSDNENLSKVEFSLKDNKQNGIASLKGTTGVGDNPWNPTKDNSFEISLSGKNQTLDKEELFGEAIPSSGIWTGVYTLTITCTDKAGNLSIKKINVNIE